MLYSDYIGPARLKLNLPEVAPELKREATPALHDELVICLTQATRHIASRWPCKAVAEAQ